MTCTGKILYQLLNSVLTDRCISATNRIRIKSFYVKIIEERLPLTDEPLCINKFCGSITV